MDNIVFYIELLAAGLIGGFLNAVASSGTAVTLPLLIFIGLSPSVANGTNRIPVVVGFIASTFTFHKAGLINWKNVMLLSIPICIGTIMGVYMVSLISDNNIDRFLIFALLLSLLLVVTKFKNIATPKLSINKPVNWKTYLLFFFIGIWAGMIVLDTASFILFTLTLHLGYDLIKANAIKSALCLIISFVSLIVFEYEGMLDWKVGLIISIGSLLGGFIGSKFAISENSRVWLFRILLSVISFEILSFIYKFIIGK
jgi:uncharacterized membrane protein YfcA